MSGVVDRPHDEVVVFGTRWVGINQGDEDKPLYRSRLVLQEYKRQADWAFFAASSPLEALRSLLICAKIEEPPNEFGQPVAQTETGVVMLKDVRGQEKSVCGTPRRSSHRQEQSWTIAQKYG